MKRIAILYGVIFTSLGILGSVPAFTPDNYLFGLFAVNGMHNILHFFTGCLGLWTAYLSETASKLFFQVFKFVYGVIAVLGFIYGSQGNFGVFANSMADAWQHLIIAIIPSFFDYASWKKWRNSIRFKTD